MTRIALLTVAVLPAMSVSAFAYCSEPSSEPWCLSDDDSFQTESGFEDCRWEVERFVDDVNDYVDCLEREQQSLRDEIEDLIREMETNEYDQAEQIERADDVIRRFNCGAESGQACW